MGRLILLFVLVSLAEIYLLWWIAEHTSWLFTFALVLVTGIAGASLTRWQGLAVWRRIQHELVQGQMPGMSLLEGVLVLAAGLMLMTPGVLTDLTGFLLLFPLSRRLLARAVSGRIRGRMNFHTFSGRGDRPASSSQQRDEVIDVEVINPTEPREPS